MGIYLGDAPKIEFTELSLKDYVYSHKAGHNQYHYKFKDMFNNESFPYIGGSVVVEHTHLGFSADSFYTQWCTLYSEDKLRKVQFKGGFREFILEGEKKDCDYVLKYIDFVTSQHFWRNLPKKPEIVKSKLTKLVEKFKKKKPQNWDFI